MVGVSAASPSVLSEDPWGVHLQCCAPNHCLYPLVLLKLRFLLCAVGSGKDLTSPGTPCWAAGSFVLSTGDSGYRGQDRGSRQLESWAARGKAETENGSYVFPGGLRFRQQTGGSLMLKSPAKLSHSSRERVDYLPLTEKGCLLGCCNSKQLATV